MTRKWCPRGDPWDPPRDPKIVKIVKKSNQKIIIFPTPVWEGFWPIFDLKNEAKMGPKWGLREQRERKQQKTQKPQICNTFHKKHLFFKVRKHAKLRKTLKNACWKRSSHKGDPPEAIFHDFASILGPPGDSEITKKQSKKRSKKSSKKRRFGRPPWSNEVQGS